jgi:hypothetical protein
MNLGIRAPDLISLFIAQRDESHNQRGKIGVGLGPVKLGAVEVNPTRPSLCNPRMTKTVSVISPLVSSASTTTTSSGWQTKPRPK